MSIVNLTQSGISAPKVKSCVKKGTIKRMMKRRWGAYGNSLGRRIELLRDDKGWTQIQLAEEVTKQGAKITSAWISELEDTRKKRAPSIKVLVALAKALSTTTDFLLMLTDDPEPVNSPPEQHWSEEADETGRLIDSLPAEWRQIALVEVQKVSEEWTEIKRQDAELMELVRRVDKAGGAVAAAIVKDYIGSRLEVLSRRRGRGGVVSELSDKSSDISQ